MTTPLSLNPQKKAAMWRAYKQRQTANHVATHCKISPHTAQKYIRELKFAERLAKLLAKANELVDEDQALSLANTLKPLANARALLLEQLLAQIKNGALEVSVTDADKIIRLERFLRGEPESRTEDFGTWKWLEEGDAAEKD